MSRFRLHLWLLLLRALQALRLSGTSAFSGAYLFSHCTLLLLLSFILLVYLHPYDLTLGWPLTITDFFLEHNSNKSYLHCKIDLAIEQSSQTLSVFDLIYNFLELELKELNLYLVKKLALRFTESKESPLLTLILFTKNETGSLRRCVDYKNLNRYLFPLFSEMFDRLKRAKDH